MRRGWLTERMSTKTLLLLFPGGPGAPELPAADGPGGWGGGGANHPEDQPPRDIHHYRSVGRVRIRLRPPEVTRRPREAHWQSRGRLDPAMNLVGCRCVMGQVHRSRLRIGSVLRRDADIEALSVLLLTCD